MEKSFQSTLHGITSQSSVLGELDEKAVEFVVVLPILQQLGWDIHDVSEVYPQLKLSNNHRPDFSLQVNGESRVVVEVKKWAADLNPDHEKQLQGYCQEVKPNLAALTNGHRWWFYVGPWTRPKGGVLFPFLDFDLMDEMATVESNFRQFLAREQLATHQDLRQTVDAARELRNRKQGHAEMMRGLTHAWNELETNHQALFDVLKKLAEDRGIHPSDSVINEFIERSGPLVNQVASGAKTSTADHSKPESFTIKGEGEESVAVAVKDWTGVRVGVCSMMRQRHGEDFHQFIADRPDWFLGAPGKYRRQIDRTGIFVPTGGTRHDILNVCHEILGQFGYCAGSLEIQMKGG